MNVENRWLRTFTTPNRLSAAFSRPEADGAVTHHGRRTTTRTEDHPVTDYLEPDVGAAGADADDPECFDYTFVYTTARIAVYDDLMSAPRIVEVEPDETAAYIEQLSQEVYRQSQAQGGSIPYTVIRELSENFIHARFAEVVISIFDHGDTIRFADQGPGIAHKLQAQQPGFTSASESMKDYIRGVGSGLPLAREYLSFSNGSLSIEDNMGTGAVVTISLARKVAPVEEQKPAAAQDVIGTPQHGMPNRQAERERAQAVRTEDRADGFEMPSLTERQKRVLRLFTAHGALGVTDIVKLTSMPQSSVHKELTHLEDHGIVEKTAGQKRVLTPFGHEIVERLEGK